MVPAISARGVGKTYANGFTALRDIDLEIKKGEIFALLGPNGAGKTTFIGAVCGIVSPSAGVIEVCGHDNAAHYRQARSLIGLVPQELTTDAFETVYNTVTFSRGLFGKKPDPAYIGELLETLSLADKRDTQIRNLSGGMKRRVLIAKALAHEPEILFLDEPSAGVDVELRKSMWRQIGKLRDSGVTIVLTTHYIEEAEEMADRVGVINKGEIVVVEEKRALLKKLGKKELCVTLSAPLAEAPACEEGAGLRLEEGGTTLIYAYDPDREDNGVETLLCAIKEKGGVIRDIETRKSSLEDIFVNLVQQA